MNTNVVAMYQLILFTNILLWTPALPLNVHMKEEILELNKKYLRLIKV